MSLPGEGWVDMGLYFYLPPELLKHVLSGQAKRKFLTGSRHAGAIGLVDKPTPQEVCDYLLHGKKIEITDIVAVEMGNKFEALLFKWYDTNICHVEQAGAAVSKESLWLLTISDGVVRDQGIPGLATPKGLLVFDRVVGVIEIKVTKYLARYLADGKMQVRHYIQIQDHIRSYHADWCDFLCYGYMQDKLIPSGKHVCIPHRLSSCLV